MNPIWYNAILAGRSSAIELLLHENFSVADPAPIDTPKTCTPGPGVLNYVDLVTGADASIVNGYYERPRPTDGHSWSNYGLYSSTSFARAPGLFFYTRMKCTIMDRVIPLSASVNAGLGESGSAWFNWQTASLIDLNEVNGGFVRISNPLTADTLYHFLLRARSSGWEFYMHGGIQYPNWTLLHVSVLSNTSPLYVQSSNFNSLASQDVVAVGKFLQDPFVWDYDPTTYFDPTPVAGDVVTGEDDGLTYFAWRPEPSETLTIRFRRTDDNNCYRLECSQAAGTIKLFRVEAGVDTELGAGQTQTWTAGTAYRIGIVHAGGSIQTFVNNTAKHDLTGETFNLTAVGLKVAGFTTGSYLEVYPRTNPTGWVSLSLLEAL